MLITPISASERRELTSRLKRHQAKLRKRYPEIHGKRVDWVEHGFTDSCLYIDIRFTDGTCFALHFQPKIEADLIEFSDMSSGDDEILRTYFLKRS